MLTAAASQPPPMLTPHVEVLTAAWSVYARLGVALVAVAFGLGAWLRAQHRRRGGGAEEGQG